MFTYSNICAIFDNVVFLNDYRVVMPCVFKLDYFRIQLKLNIVDHEYNEAHKNSGHNLR